MKKIALIVLAAFLFTISPLKADEGMWLLPLIEKLNNKKMSQLGLKLSAKDIYNINGSSLKDAVVHFGNGCTGEIVSSEGLLLTNHHCGYGSIQKLSTVEHDYLQNGYWAMNREQELPAAGLTVTFLESFTDVTKDIEQALLKATSPEMKQSVINETIKTLTEKAIKGNKYLKAQVVSMYSDNAFYLVVTKTFNDIRFVGAPPSSVGKFGADTDNWMWPRHTGDFSMFRIYADKDNNPAPYSPDNKPYIPKNHLAISLKGVKQNDFSMILGFPGRTNRFMTSAEVKQTSDVTNAITIYARGIRQDIMMKEMLADPKIRIQYSSKYAYSSNFWKKAIGMNETFKKLNVAERRAQEEKEFTEWVNADKTRIEKYGTALDDINKALISREKPIYVYKYLTETLGNIELMGIASNYLKTNSTENLFTDYDAGVDRKITKAMIKAYKDKVSDNLPALYKVIDTDFAGNIDAYVDYVFDNSVFTSKEKLQNAINTNKDLINNDPAITLGRNMQTNLSAILKALNESNIVYSKGVKSYTAGLMEMKKGQAMYPDANSTMRLSYGNVLNYSPKDGVRYLHYTTLKGVMEKEDPDNWEFVVPDKLKELYNNKDYGQYAMKDGNLPVAFITNNDITGGNSGSPVMNAKGELIGLAFDGNWEAMSGDIIFEPTLQRCINVDIRYVLFIMDKFGGAGYLLKEMTINK